MSKLKKIIGTLLIAILECFTTHAQDTIKKQDTLKRPPIRPKSELTLKERLYTGGTIGLQFGTLTFIDISPLLGFKVTEKFSAGVGATYIHLNDKRFIKSYQVNIYGGRIFARYFLLENIFVHGEYEVLNIDWDPNSDNRINVASLMAGAGYRQQVGAFSYFTLLILYNFNDSIYSPYSNPIIRGGFIIGM